LTIFDNPVDENASMAGHKALPYKENLDLLNQARAGGFDDGIRLNMAGYICESAVANVMMKVEGRWITPTLSSGCLPGITRAVAIEWFGISEEDLLGSEISTIESMFLLSSLKNLQPVEFLNGRKLDMSEELLQVARAQTAQDLVD
jgi:branched-chain amino acid aminotransferase